MTLAKKLNARDVFFVNDEPVIVLANLPEGADEADYFNRVWCMARPQLLFLAREGELAVYQLSTPPIRENERLRTAERLLALVKSVEDIQQHLGNFRREQIESGEVFLDERFGNGAFRADRALVQDLKIVHRLLTTGDDKLSDSVAHALIGRSLFVRYLEDREILVPGYFEALTHSKPEWIKLLDRKPVSIFPDPYFEDVRFFRVLENKEFTYTFFKQLAADFHGDTFPVTQQERKEVKPKHLKLLRGLLMGEANPDQEQLFLFAYRFEYIPIELISSIYEEFYTTQQGRGKTQSSYYTSPALVDFLLSRVLTDDTLEQSPRVIDPACGSGIFLVEAFRRMVRFRIKRKGWITQPELRKILRAQIRGIDLNPEAVPIAAFSLYLAYLHYQEPREINASRRLPNLRWDEKREARNYQQHFDILYPGNAFEAIDHPSPIVRRHFGPNCADIVVGNPPWGEVKKTDARGVQALKVTKAWYAAAPERSVGDSEMSQAFVHLALELLADGGKAAMLLSSGVLFKQHEKSQAFRRSWLRRSRLNFIVNFAHVRHIHFSDPRRENKDSGARESDGCAPFISAIFTKGVPERGHRFSLWSARRTATVDKTRAIIISQSDMHRLRQNDCLHFEELWKIYWWGGRRDEGLIREIERFPRLGEVALAAKPDVAPAQGYTPGNQRDAPSWLAKYKELPARRLRRYGTLMELGLVSPPARVHRPGQEGLFNGPRLVVGRGVGSRSDERSIVSRFESDSFCFTNSVASFRLDGLSEDERLIVLGIYWSSLAEYYFWLTANSWGMWHDEIQKHCAISLPIAIPENVALCSRIVAIVNDLREINPLLLARISELESNLDKAIYDLYELNAADRDLVSDMRQYGIDFYYKRGDSVAVKPVLLPKKMLGSRADLPAQDASGLVGYLQVFLRQWNVDLAPENELIWEIVRSPGSSPVLALIFSIVRKGAVPDSVVTNNISEWNQVLTRISDNSLVPITSMKTLYTDTFIPRCK